MTWFNGGMILSRGGARAPQPSTHTTNRVVAGKTSNHIATERDHLCLTKAATKRPQIASGRPAVRINEVGAVKIALSGVLPLSLSRNSRTGRLRRSAANSLERSLGSCARNSRNWGPGCSRSGRDGRRLRCPGHRRCWSNCGRSHRQAPVRPCHRAVYPSACRVDWGCRRDP